MPNDNIRKLTPEEVSDICKSEMEKVITNVSMLLESAYKWQDEKMVDYKIFRFSNPLFYNTKRHIDFIENNSIRMYICILKCLLKKSGYTLETEFEDINDSPIEFIASFASLKKTAFCFKTKIEGEAWADLKEKEGFDELNVIFLATDVNMSFKERYEKNGIPKKVYLGDDVFKLFDEYLGDGIGDIVRDYFRKYILDIRNRLGIIAIHSTSETKTYNLKLRIRDYIQNTDFVNQGFWEIEEEKDRYGLISYKVNFISAVSLGIESKNKDVIKKQFYDNRYYEIMLGKSEFANSLLTSEWLYHSFQNKIVSKSEKYDFTPVICGYLKSMEQLIFLLMKCLVDKGYYAQATWDDYLYDNLKRNKIRYETRTTSKGKKYTDIALLDKSLEYVDTQLGALIIFLLQPTSHKPVLNTSRLEICTLLNKFRDECRNGYFHTDNVYSWDIVEKVRSNAYLLYFLIIGDCCNLSLDNSVLGVSFQSKYEAFCKKIGPYFSSGKRVVMVKDGEEKEINIDVDEEPIYENGTRIYSHILVTYYEKMDSSDEIGYLSDPFYLTEDTMPDEIYTLDLITNEKEIIWEK